MYRSRRSRLRCVCAILTVVIAAACSPFAGPDDEVLVVVEGAHFDANEHIGFEIINRMADSIRIGICANGSIHSDLLRRVGGEWTRAGGRCTPTERIVLLPGDRLAGWRAGGDEEGLYGLAIPYVIPEADGSLDLDRPRLVNSDPFQITD